MIFRVKTDRIKTRKKSRVFIFFCGQKRKSWLKHYFVHCCRKMFLVSCHSLLFFLPKKSEYSFKNRWDLIQRNEICSKLRLEANFFPNWLCCAWFYNIFGDISDYTDATVCLKDEVSYFIHKFLAWLWDKVRYGLLAEWNCFDLIEMWCVKALWHDLRVLINVWKEMSSS